MRLLLLHAPAPIVRELCRRDVELVSCNSSNSFNTHDQLPESFAPKQRTINISGRKKICRQAIRSVSEIVDDFRPDLIHAFLPDSLAWALFATWNLKSAPKIVSFRGITRVPNRWDPSDWISYLSRRVAMHACESHAVRDAMLQAGIPAEKCSVTYNTMWDFDSPKSPEQWRRDWNVSSEEILLGCVGTIRKIKGTDLLIKAVENLPKHLPWRLVVIGSIVDKTIAQAIESSPVRSRIITTGELKHAVSAMRAMDLFVMPSRSEGLGRALIEACSVGVCPVVSDAGGMKELVRNQIDGWVFQRGNVDQLTDALTQLIGNQSLRNNFAHSAQNNVSELCSPANVTDRLLAIYTQALQHRTRTPAAI